MAKSNAGDKLKNIKAIQDMLQGTHKSQTRQHHYYGNTKTETPEEDILEKFEDGKPKIWIETDANGHRTRVQQHEGWKSRESESGYLVRKAIKSLEMPRNCPSCNKDMYSEEKRLNEKFWNIQKKCYDCVVKYETKLRNDPEAWDKYQKEKMYENAKAFFKDADGDVEGLRKMLTEEVKNVQNADGLIEIFGSTMTVEEFDKKILSEYKLYKKNVLKGFKKGE